LEPLPNKAWCNERRLGKASAGIADTKGCESRAMVSTSEITAQEAAEIAARSRSAELSSLPERWTQPFKVTEEPPEGLYRFWEDEPAWYVWFLPRHFGLGSSEVVVVSKRTGRAIGKRVGGRLAEIEADRSASGACPVRSGSVLAPMWPRRGGV